MGKRREKVVYRQHKGDDLKRERDEMRVLSTASISKQQEQASGAKIQHPNTTNKNVLPVMNRHEQWRFLCNASDEVQAIYEADLHFNWQWPVSQYRSMLKIDMHIDTVSQFACTF